jgi:hypothetical protein
VCLGLPSVLVLQGLSKDYTKRIKVIKAAATKIQLYMQVLQIYTQMNFNYLCCSQAGVWSPLFPVIDCTEDKPPISGCAVSWCETMSGRNCKVMQIVMVALVSFSVLTSHTVIQRNLYANCLCVQFTLSYYQLWYFSIDNAHPELFRHSFWCIENARDAN